MVDRIKDILATNTDLRRLTEQSLAQAHRRNPDPLTNPVQNLEQWLSYLERFLQRMPWQSLALGEDISLFRRIDQCIGYFYFLIDQPLPRLDGRGYPYPSLQYEPRMAMWLRDYNKAWGERLNREDSWCEESYRLALGDSRFQLNTDRYESPEHWHCWNDFFARRLRRPLPVSGKGLISPCDGVITNAPVKTASINRWTDLLGDSPYRHVFADGDTFHITLDIYDYHRFHAPCTGQVLECKTIQGIHAGGGVIVWDETEHRYRYERIGATDFQMLETRGVLVLDTQDFGKMALVSVGVQQVSSVVWDEYVQVGADLHQGDELGRFLFGGSDVVMMFEKGKAPSVAPDKSLKAGETLI